MLLAGIEAKISNETRGIVFCLSEKNDRLLIDAWDYHQYKLWKSEEKIGETRLIGDPLSTNSAFHRAHLPEQKAQAPFTPMGITPRLAGTPH